MEPSVDALEQLLMLAYETSATQPTPALLTAAARLFPDAPSEFLAQRCCALAEAAVGLGFGVNRGEQSSSAAHEALKNAFRDFPPELCAKLLARAFFDTR